MLIPVCCDARIQLILMSGLRVLEMWCLTSLSAHRRTTYKMATHHSLEGPTSLDSSCGIKSNMTFGIDQPDLQNPMKSEDLENDRAQGKEFVLGTRGALAFFTLAVLALMAALDGTSLSVALPVSLTMHARGQC